MKILLVGATGTIGGEVLSQCLADPDISSIVVFLRRELPPESAKSAKLQCVIKHDFGQWTEDELQPHADAASMIWTMGTYDGSVTVDLEYPLAFQDAFVKVLAALPNRPKFRYIHLSGRLSVQDQDKTLYFLRAPRTIKGLHETKAIAFAEQHSSCWQTFIVRPGGVISRTKFGMGALGTLLSKSWSIDIEELGAYMTYLAVGGSESGTMIENKRMVEIGRELLKNGRLDS